LRGRAPSGVQDEGKKKYDNVEEDVFHHAARVNVGTNHEQRS
jgi:hypothetical protein